MNPEDREEGGRGGGGREGETRRGAEGEELETEERGEVGLRSRRKSWLITSLQRDDRFSTSRGESERERESEANLARQPGSPTCRYHATRFTILLPLVYRRYTLLRLAVFYDQLRADSECLCKPAKPFGLNCREFFITFFLSLFLSIFRQ